MFNQDIAEHIIMVALETGVYVSGRFAEQYIHKHKVQQNVQKNTLDGEVLDLLRTVYGVFDTDMDLPRDRSSDLNIVAILQKLGSQYVDKQVVNIYYQYQSLPYLLFYEIKFDQFKIKTVDVHKYRTGDGMYLQETIHYLYQQGVLIKSTRTVEYLIQSTIFYGEGDVAARLTSSWDSNPGLVTTYLRTGEILNWFGEVIVNRNMDYVHPPEIRNLLRR